MTSPTTPYWNGDQVIEPRVEYADPQQLQCAHCEYVGSIDLFECGGIDIELPEIGIGPNEGNDVWCPKCGEETPAVFAEAPTDQGMLFT